MVTFFVSLVIFIVLSAFILILGSPENIQLAFGADPGVFFGIYAASVYLTILAFFFYVGLRFKENSDRFNKLLSQKKRIEELISMLEKEKENGNISNQDYSKHLAEYNSVLDAVEKALFVRSSKLRGIIRKREVTFIDRLRFLVVNFFSTKKIKLQEVSKAKTIPKDDLAEIYKLVLVLEPYKKMYSKEEIKTALGQEGYSSSVAAKVANVLYGK